MPLYVLDQDHWPTGLDRGGLEILVSQGGTRMGMRPHEVCEMRPIDIDMTGSVWLYQPARHKTMHRQKIRVVPMGPKCQEIIRPFLQRDVEVFLFSPREAMDQRWSERQTHRRKPPETPRTSWRVGSKYPAKDYGHCVWKVCDQQGIPHWSPNQLRHNAATRLRKEFGLDVAQVILGHSRADVTQVYAALDLDKAVAVMEKVG